MSCGFEALGQEGYPPSPAAGPRGIAMTISRIVGCALSNCHPFHPGRDRPGKRPPWRAGLLADQTMRSGAGQLGAARVDFSFRVSFVWRTVTGLDDDIKQSSQQE